MRSSREDDSDPRQATERTRRQPGAHQCVISRGSRGQSVARIKASPFVPHKDAIRGFVFDVATGKLSEVR